MKNRTILGLICIGLALGIAFGIAPLVNRLSDNKLEIVRVCREVRQGHRMTEEDVEIVTVGSYHLPQDVLTDPDAVIGKYAVYNMTAGDYLLPAKLADSADSAEDVFRSLDGSQYAVSVTIPTFAGGLSGKLENGDIVSLIVYQNRNGKESTWIPESLKYVRVITSTTAGGLDRDELVQNEDGSYELPTTLTLLVSDAQAKLLAEYEYSGKLHAALVCRGDEKKAQDLLAKQQEILDGNGGRT